MNRTKIRTMRKFPPQNISCLNISIGTCLTCPCLQAELEEAGGQSCRLCKAAVRILVEGPEEIDQLRAFRTSGGVSRVCRCVCNQYKQIHANTSTYKLIQLHTSTGTYKPIQMYTSTYMQIQVYTSTYKYRHANTSIYKQIQAIPMIDSSIGMYLVVFVCICSICICLCMYLSVLSITLISSNQMPWVRGVSERAASAS